MKASFPIRLSAFLLSALLCVTAARAQKQGDNPAYYLLTIQTTLTVPQGPVTYGGGSASFNIWDELYQSTAFSSIGGAISTTQNSVYSAVGTLVHILPNRDYKCNIVMTAGCTGNFSFVTPSTKGFVVYINGKPATSYSHTNTNARPAGGNDTTAVTLRIALPNNYSADPEPDYLAAGASNSMVSDKPILYFGLGRMRNGNPAGVVGFRAQDFASASLFTPAALYYSSYYPAPTGEVTQISTTTGSNPPVLRQILSRETLVDINAISGTSYKLDFYPSSAVTGQPGGANTAYTFSGSPFVSYTVSQNTTSGISVTRTEDATNWETDLVLSGSTWTFKNWYKQGTALNSYISTAYTSSTAATGSAIGPASGLAGYTDTALNWTKGYTSYSWGLELTHTQRGSTTSLITNNSYYTTTAASGSTGAYNTLLQWATYQDGTWAAYSYYSGDSTNATTIPSGYVARMYHPWLDTTASDTTGSVAAAATTSNSAYDDYTYTYVAKGDSGGTGSTAALFLPASATSYAPGGTVLKKSTWGYNTRVMTLNTRYVWSQTEYDFSDSTNSVATTSLFYVPVDVSISGPDILDDQPVSVTYANGRKDSYAYYFGTWNASTNTFSASTTGSDRLILCLHGQTTGGTATSSWTSGSVSTAIDSVNMVANYSTATETVIDTNGRIVFSGQDVYTGPSAAARVAGIANTYDTHGRLTDAVDVIRSIGTTATTIYSTHRNYTSQLLNWETAPDGTYTSYLYDDLLRPTQKTIGVTSLGNAGIYPAKVQSTTYDGVNRPVATYTCSCGTAPLVFWYDDAGRVSLKSEPSPNAGASLSTSYTYSSLTSTTTTQPTGATTINATYADGRAKSVSGTAQPPIYYNYSANVTGLLVTRLNSTSSTDQSQGWATDQADLLERNITHSSPTYGWASNVNNIIDITFNYNPSTGLLNYSRTTYRATGSLLAPDHLYNYDSSGRLYQDGLDLNADGVLTAAGNDRFTSYGLSFSVIGSGWVSLATTSTYPAGVAVQLSSVSTRLSGFNGGSLGTNGLVVSDVTTIDANGQSSNQTESVDTATLRHHIDLTLPGNTQKGWSETINGYAAESMAPSGARAKNEYDARGRLVTTRSRYNGTSYLAADTISFSGSNYSKLPDSQTIDTVQTNFAYSWGSPSGTSAVTTTDAQGNASYILYNAMGRPWHMGGAAASPTQYGYDALGRLVTQTTWRTGPYTEANWPASISTGDTTSWGLETATGLGLSKTFADANHVDFTYTPLGQPLVRSWARVLPSTSTRVTATYAYFDGTTTANTDVSHRTQELRSVTYNDGTPGVAYTYKRSGLPDTITDASGTRSFAYDSIQPLRITSEALSSFYGSRVETQQYDAVYRPAGFLLGASAGSYSDLSQVVAYNGATGLPSTLTTTPAGQIARAFTYSFVANTQLISGYSTGTGATAFALSYGYESATNRRNQVKSTMGGATIAEFDPSYDSRGNMQTISQSGSAFADYYNSNYSSVLNAFNYDAMGELTTSAMYRGSTTVSAPVPGDELPGHRFEIRYDSMGNRKSSGETGNLPANGGSDDGYTPTNLNQYSQKTNNTVRVVGTVGSTAGTTVAVAAAPSTNKLDRSWVGDIAPNQGTAPATGTATVYAAIPGNPDVLRTDNSKTWTIPPTPQIFSYDADGNLIADGLWSYTYDAESRLIGMQNLASAIGNGMISAGNARKLVFTYDYLGRRIEKQVYGGWNGSVYSSTAILDRKFIYKGWNLIAEYNALSTLTLTRSYTWGLDLVGSFGGTGGMGALLQITDHVAAKNYYAAYDQNGNVVALDRDDGTLAAGYEYSAFGEPMRADVLDSVVADNPFRFSTKYTDLESGLVYYGNRYYGSREGRFINRDPIQESGGINLYGFAGNNSVSHWDVLGLTTKCYDEVINGVHIPVCVTDDSNIPDGATFLGGCNNCSLDSNGNLIGTTYDYTPTANGGFTSVATNHAVGGQSSYSGTIHGGNPNYWAQDEGGAGAFAHVYDGWLPWDEQNNRWTTGADIYNSLFLAELLYQIPVFSIGYKAGTAIFGKDQFTGNKQSRSGLLLEAGIDAGVTFTAASLEGKMFSFDLSGAPAQLRAGQIAEGQALEAIGTNGKVVFTPTAEQIDSAAFKLIVGEAEYTESGSPVSTIFDGSNSNGLFEIKSGSSLLNSSYQIRLQTYGSLVNNQPYSIFTSRPINPGFSSWLARWGVSVQPLP